MKKTIITVMVICLMSFTLAYYPGETYVFPNEMEVENLVYTIVGNSSPISPLNISINSTNITIIFPGDMAPDTFDIVFLENQTHEVVQIVYRGGGGGSRTRYVDKNVTVYVPEYVETTKEVRVEDIVASIEYIQTGFETWHIILAMVVGGLFVWFIFANEKNKEIEELKRPEMEYNKSKTK